MGGIEASLDDNKSGIARTVPDWGRVLGLEPNVIRQSLYRVGELPHKSADGRNVYSYEQLERVCSEGQRRSKFWRAIRDFAPDKNLSPVNSVSESEDHPEPVHTGVEDDEIVMSLKQWAQSLGVTVSYMSTVHMKCHPHLDKRKYNGRLCSVLSMQQLLTYCSTMARRGQKIHEGIERLAKMSDVGGEQNPVMDELTVLRNQTAPAKQVGTETSTEVRGSVIDDIVGRLIPLTEWGKTLGFKSSYFYDWKRRYGLPLEKMVWGNRIQNATRYEDLVRCAQEAGSKSKLYRSLQAYATEKDLPFIEDDQAVNTPVPVTQEEHKHNTATERLGSSESQEPRPEPKQRFVRGTIQLPKAEDTKDARPDKQKSAYWGTFKESMKMLGVYAASRVLSRGKEAFDNKDELASEINEVYQDCVRPAILDLLWERLTHPNQDFIYPVEGSQSPHFRKIALTLKEYLQHSGDFMLYNEAGREGKRREFLGALDLEVKAAFYDTARIEAPKLAKQADGHRRLGKSLIELLNTPPKGRTLSVQWDPD